MTTHEIRITHAPDLTGTFHIDGCDVTPMVLGYSVDLAAAGRERPTVTIAFAPGHLEIDGIAEAAEVVTAHHVAEHMADMFDGVDPARIEQRALALIGGGLGGGRSTGEAFVAALREHITGEPADA